MRDMETIGYTGESGALYAIEVYRKVLPLSEITHDDRNKKLCGACSEYGKNLSCPPHSPSFTDHAGKATSARVIRYRISLDQFSPALPDKSRVAFGILKRLLTEELLKAHDNGQIVAGAGACLVCEKCVAQGIGGKCAYPSMRIYSLESLGVNVSSLAEKAFGFGLEWSEMGGEPRHISAIGATFHA